MPPPPVEFSPPPFLDVPSLLELSRPRPRGNGMGLAVLACLALAGVMAVTAGRGGPGSTGASVTADALLLVVAGASVATVAVSVHAHRRQAGAVEAVEEMVRLRRWEPAAHLLQTFLARPVRSPRVWAKALVQLAAVLARHHRFEDALAVDDFLMEHDGLLDEPSAYAVRLGRAMCLIRDDRLLDADRAIGDLRRRGPRASGPLTLVEVYRDVKTGHPAEAVELYDGRQDAIRRHLGHRAADVHALAARAFDLLGRADAADAAYRRATLLAPAAELHRRYPTELDPLLGRFTPAPAPREVA